MTVDPRLPPRHHPVVQRHEAERLHDVQLRFADAITALAAP